MGLFLFAAIGLIGVTVLLLLRPWQSAGADRDATTREINAGIYRDQLAELDRDLATGTLAAADHAQARAELQRRLLQDTAEADAATPEGRSSTRRTSLVLAVVLPLAATGLYAWLGAPTALLPPAAPTAAAANRTPTAAEIDQMVAGLAARLEQNPDPKGWAILARSYHALGRFAEAGAAFGRVGDTLDHDPVLLADYADTLATLAGGKLEGRPLELVRAALRLDPNNPMALSLAATAAYQRQDFAEAAQHWQRLLVQLPPESEEAKWLRTRLAEIGTPAASGNAPAAGAAAPADKASTAVAAAPTDKASTAIAAAPTEKVATGTPAGSAAVSGSVTLAPQLLGKVQPTDTVFVFARPVDGSRMPLAVQRARVADLPLQFRLDDSLAISPQARLSAATEVRIEARISRSGDATPGAGDLFGISPTVKTGASRVALQIDQVRP
jgi:cytochrome c-type biogenesis protein CcmH